MRDVKFSNGGRTVRKLLCFTRRPAKSRVEVSHSVSGKVRKSFEKAMWLFSVILLFASHPRRRIGTDFSLSSKRRVKCKCFRFVNAQTSVSISLKKSSTKSASAAKKLFSLSNSLFLDKAFDNPARER